LAAGVTEWAETGFVISGPEGGPFTRVIANTEMTRNGSFVQMYLNFPGGEPVWLSMHADDLAVLVQAEHGESAFVHIETDRKL